MNAAQILYGAGIGLFVCGGGVAIGVIAPSIAPNWPRIARLLRGEIEAVPPSLAPLGQAR